MSVTQALSQVVPFVIPFLTWRDRWRLAQVNHETRSTILDVMYEKEAFLHIAKVYNSFIEVFESAASPEGGETQPYYGCLFYYSCDEPNPELLSIKSWIGALMRIETLYARHLKYPPTLPVADEVWKVLPDERLDDLVKRVQFLSSNFVTEFLCGEFVTEDSNSWESTLYLRFVKRYAYPKQQKFSMQNFLALIDKGKYLKLAKIAGDITKCFAYMYETPYRLLQTAVRLVYVPKRGILTSIQKCRISGVSKRVALQPFITRAVMKNQDLLESNAFQPGRSPYYFLRWLTGIDNGESRDPVLQRHLYGLSSDPSLQRYTPALDQLKAHQDLLSLDPAIFWDTQTYSHTAQLGAGELGDDVQNLDVDYTDWNDLSRDELKSYVAHWKYAMHQIEEYLATVFRPFNLEEAQQLIDAYTESGLDLVQSGDPETSVGAYLEVSLTDSYAGPNDTFATDDFQNITVVLYVGPDEAVLYEF